MLENKRMQHRLLVVLAKLIDEEYFNNHMNGTSYDDAYQYAGFNLHKMQHEFKQAGILPESILDAGCATGRTIIDMLARGYDAYGIEVSEHAYSQIPPEVSDRCVLGDIRNIKNLFSPGSFDIVYTNSLMYIPEKEIPELLTDMCSIASMGIYLVTPYLDCPGTIPVDSYRVSLLPRSWWRNVLSRCGLKCCGYSGSLWLKANQ